MEPAPSPANKPKIHRFVFVICGLLMLVCAIALIFVSANRRHLARHHDADRPIPSLTP